MSIVVWDIETDCSFKSLSGMPREQQLSVMQATVACALVLKSQDCVVPGNWDAARQNAEWHTFWRDVSRDNRDPFADLLVLFDHAEVIVAYNGIQFDFPVMRKHYGRGKTAQQRYVDHRSKTLDPMLQLAHATGLPYFKLDNLLRWNQLPTKIGTGLEAILMWEHGRRDELEQYCIRDVEALAHMVSLSQLQVASVGCLPNSVHGLSSAILRQSAQRAAPIEEGFVLLHSPQSSILPVSPNSPATVAASSNGASCHTEHGLCLDCDTVRSASGPL